MANNYSDNFLTYTQKAVKNLAVVVKFEGLDTVISSVPIGKRIRYGDPIKYGDPNLVYGGLIPYQDAQGNLLFKTLLDVSSSSMNLTQRLEPEQGRGAISTISLSFVDVNQYMTQLCSPGIILPEILGRLVTVYLGYQEISFPDDYLVIFRGRVTSTEAQSGKIVIQLSDPNVIRKQNVFFTASTTLTAPITTGSTTINVASNADFHKAILGPNGSYDTAIKTYLSIGSEFIEYGPSGFGTNQFTGCTRGARGTIATAAAAGDTVSAAVQIEDHSIDMALKLMLSGWQGPYLSDQLIQNISRTGDPVLGDVPNGIMIPNGVDADLDLGISEGDYITVSGALNGANNVTCRVLQLTSANGFNNNLILTDYNGFIVEVATPATLAIRSQYDTYPDNLGVQLPATDVDVKGHQDLKARYLSSDENKLRFFITKQETCKTFIESEIYLPMACYSLTRYGRLSVKLTKAPLAGETLQILNHTNVKDPANIKPQRSTNNRKFFNEVDWYFDADDAGNFTNIVRTFDTDSLNNIGLTSLLPIKSMGIKSDLGTVPLIQNRTAFLMQRYKNGAIMLDINVLWAVGVLIESGDIVAIDDQGILQITNFNTGVRNFGVQLMETIDRQIDLKSGAVTLKLVSGVGSLITDRYGVISPSSVIAHGDTSSITIQDSFGALYPSQEYRKWQQYVGLPLFIHSDDYAYSATAHFFALDPGNKYRMMLTGYAGDAPSAGMIVDIARYSESTDAYVDGLYKSIHAFFDKQVNAVSGINQTSFLVPPSATQYFHVGLPVILHDDLWSLVSSERNVTAIDSLNNIITVGGNLGYSPPSACFVDLLGFPDDQGPYRWA